MAVGGVAGTMPPASLKIGFELDDARVTEVHQWLENANRRNDQPLLATEQVAATLAAFKGCAPLAQAIRNLHSAYQLEISEASLCVVKAIDRHRITVSDREAAERLAQHAFDDVKLTKERLELAQKLLEAEKEPVRTLSIASVDTPGLAGLGTPAPGTDLPRRTSALEIEVPALQQKLADGLRRLEEVRMERSKASQEESEAKAALRAYRDKLFDPLVVTLNECERLQDLERRPLLTKLIQRFKLEPGDVSASAQLGTLIMHCKHLQSVLDDPSWGPTNDPVSLWYDRFLKPGVFFGEHPTIISDLQGRLREEGLLDNNGRLVPGKATFISILEAVRTLCQIRETSEPQYGLPQPKAPAQKPKHGTSCRRTRG